MKIKCSCGNLVVKGNIENTSKKGGGTRKIFVPKREIIGYKDFGKVFGKIYVYEPVFLHGEIHRNGSNNPEKWTGVCSDCQKKGKEEV